MANFSEVGKIVGQVRENQAKNCSFVTFGLLARSDNPKKFSSENKNDIWNVSVRFYGSGGDWLKNYIKRGGEQIYIRSAECYPDEYNGKTTLQVVADYRNVKPVFTGNTTTTATTSEPNTVSEPSVDAGF